jgi:hypothetical protein
MFGEVPDYVHVDNFIPCSDVRGVQVLEEQAAASHKKARHG